MVLFSRALASVSRGTRAMATKGPNAPYIYDWPRAAVTADAVVVDATPPSASILLIQRGHAPGKGKFALPGGFLDVDEPPAAAASRELQEETGVVLGEPMTIVGAYGAKGRDPRGWCVTVCYAGVSRDGSARASARAGDDAAALGWHDIKSLPPLAFDHALIIKDALTVLAAKETDAGLKAALEDGAAKLDGAWEPMQE
jgi:8-oxo-dGTP diphosphatase